MNDDGLILGASQTFGSFDAKTMYFYKLKNLF